MKTYDVSRLPSSITLGWDGENNWRPIAFDCSALLAGHPDGVVTLWILPKSETQAFPVALSRDGNVVTWTPLNEEMTAERGQLQIVVQDGTDVGKSKVVDYTVHDSLVGGADHPAETPSWAVQVVADVTEQADRAEAAAESIEQTVADAVEDYIEQHPVTVEETDPTVPAWAKNPQKPSYTAAEVGALPDSYTPPVTSVNGQTGDVVIQAGGGAVDSVNGKTGAVVLDASDVGALPDDTVIPAAVTESTVSGWGFTKNTGTYSKPSGGIPKADLASDVQTSLGKADTALQPAALQTELDDNVSPGRFVLVRNGNTLTTVDTFISIVSLFISTSRRVMFIIVVSQNGGTVTSALELYPTMVDSNSRQLTLVGEYDGNRYTAELTAASLSSTMTGTLVVEPIVTESDIPDASTSAPAMDGTAAVGTSTDYARADHVHPSDTTRLSTTGNAYRSASIPMGHLDATSTATVMTATVPGITELRDGVCMWLRNGVITSASGFTLNVNGLGAKPCYSSLAAESRSTTIFNDNYTMLMIYNSTRVDGGCWDIVYGVDTNTTYTPVKLGFGYGTCTTAAATAAKTASISSYALTTGGIVSIKFDNDVPANATLNITSNGAKAIYHRGAAITAGVIKAGDTATFVYSTYYHLISVDRDEAGDTLPAVTASDNGKFLRVVNGAWAAEAGDEYDAYSALPSDTASGAIASFPDGADDAPVKSLVAQIAPVQSGSGDPSPTNIRPISGWTSATVTRTGADNRSDTYTIAFPAEAGTVYGGTLDAANGVLTVDSAIVDMGTLNWMYYSTQQKIVAQVNSAKPAAANVGLDGACSVYKVVNTGYRYMPDKSILIGNNFISNNYAAMVVFDSAYTDAATFKTAVSGQTLVFPIRNPVTYQLTPTEVKTLLGVNNIWADTGDVAVDYRADTGLYIQKLTGSTEEGMIADAPIASGKYFLVGNTLYLSTAAIAAGATLTPGTNCVKTNLAEALNALNS